MIVVRHAQPNDESATGGHGDPPLSPLGLRQADALCEYLQGEPIDKIVASPMVRARQTGEPLAARLNMDIEFDDDLKEAGWDAGAYMRTEENLAFFIDKMTEDPDFLYAPEGRPAFRERVVRSFTRIANQNSGKTVAVFCHGMVTATITEHAIGHELDGGALHPNYTSITRVQASPSRDLWTLTSFNEHMHLRGIAND